MDRIKKEMTEPETVMEFYNLLWGLGTELE
jgi:hypothetical protein